jgi:branched-chain amino acid transport system substrate-binding protein
VQSFVQRFRAKYDQEPDTFNAGAYDTMILFTRLVAGYGATRDAMQTGLLQIKDLPSVIYGTVSFDPLTRRVPNARYKHLIVKDGKFALWDDKHPT